MVNFSFWKMISIFWDCGEIYFENGFFLCWKRYVKLAPNFSWNNFGQCTVLVITVCFREEKKLSFVSLETLVLGSLGGVNEVIFVFLLVFVYPFAHFWPFLRKSTCGALRESSFPKFTFFLFTTHLEKKTQNLGKIVVGVEGGEGGGGGGGILLEQVTSQKRRCDLASEVQVDLEIFRPSRGNFPKNEKWNISAFCKRVCVCAKTWLCLVRYLTKTAATACKRRAKHASTVAEKLGAEKLNGCWKIKWVPKN